MEKNYSVSKVYIAACAGIAIFGVVMFALGALMSPLTQKIPEAITLPQYMSVGIIIGTLLFGPIVDKFGYKWLLVAASISSLIGIIAIALLENILLLRIAIILLGIGGGILNGETSALVSDVCTDEKRGKRMSLMSAFYCIGALLWTLSCTIISNFLIPLTVASIIIVAFIIYFCVIDFPKAKSQGDVSYVESVKLLKYPVLLFFSIVLFFQSGFEGISGNYTAKFLTDNGVSISAATFALTMYTIGMLIGRLLLGSLMQKIKDLKLLSGYLFIALVGSLMMYFSKQSILIPYISMTLIGFGAGATFPVILSRIGIVFSNKTGSAFSAAMFIALCGNYTLNFITGQAFSGESQDLFPIYLSGAVIAMFIFLPIAVKTALNFAKKNNI